MKAFRLTIIGVLLCLIIGCSQQEKYTSEIIGLQKQLKNDPRNVSIFKDLIKALYDKEYYKGALQYSEELLKITTGEPVGYLYAGLSNEQLRKWDDAERYYKELCVKFPDIVEGWYRLAVLQYKKGEYKNCIDNLEKIRTIAIPAIDTEINIINFLAEAYYYDNDVKKAYSTLDMALKLDPLHKEILYNYGVWLLRDGKYKDAEQYLIKLTAQNPDAEYPYIRLAKAYYHAHEYERAERAFLDASRFDSSVKILADIVRVQDTYSTYKDINTAMIKVNEHYDYKSGDKYYIRGIIENMGLEMAENASVIVRVYDKNDKIIEQEVFETSPKNIRPEQYVFFNVEISYNEDISYVKIEPNWHKRSTSLYLK